MSFWQSNSNPELAVTGTATSRHKRPNSGKEKQRAHSASKGSTRSHIFGIPDSPKHDSSPARSGGGSHGNSGSTRTKYSTPEAPRPGSSRPPKYGATVASDAAVITKSELEATKRTLAKSEDHKSRYEDQPMEVRVSKSRHGERRKAPAGVPQLQLGLLSDEQDQLIHPAAESVPHYHTPDSKTSIISWGTPVSSMRHAGNKSRGGDWQVHQNRQVSQASASRQHKRPEDMPALDLQLSQDGADLKKALAAQREENAAEQAKNNETDVRIDTNKVGDNRVAEQQEHPGSMRTASQMEQIHQQTREEKDKLHADRKKELVMETVLVDQLSRAAVSDPDIVDTPVSANMAPKLRKQMELYNTRSRQPGTNTENLLSKRVRFAARIVTKDGHDAHRELNGFFFVADNTLTIYEFRQFGTRASALPFIQRGTYSYIHGRKKGQPYTLKDIHMGSSLSFLTSDQLSLPETIRAKPVTTFRITEVDEGAKEILLYDGCRSPAERRLRADNMDETVSKSELEEKQLIKRVQDLVRNQLQKRAVKTMMGLGKHFQALDRSGDGVLDKQELRQALAVYHIQVPEEVFGQLWYILDANNDGALDYGEFVRGFIGEMDEKRKFYVRKVFHKLDPSKTGSVGLVNMKMFFCAKKHPHVVSGEASESEVESSFLSCFEHCHTKGQVTYAEFEAYYEGVSINIKDDQEFVSMMRGCWGI